MQINLNNICVPTDFSDHALHAVRYAATFGARFKAKVHLLHVVQDIVPTVPEPGLAILPTDDIVKSLQKGAEEGLDNLIASESLAGLEVVKAVRTGVPFHEICLYAKQAKIDLLILATHGRTGLAHFLLGSVAERVVRASPCPVLTVRHPEHEFVVPD